MRVHHAARRHTRYAGLHDPTAAMRLACCLALFVVAGPAAGQTLTGGVGWGSVSDGRETVVFAGLATVPAGAWQVGVYGAYDTEIVLTGDWVDWQGVGALLAGRSVDVGALRLSALAGPALAYARRAPNVSPARPDDPALEPGAVVRAQAAAFPLRRLPVGLALDVGLTATTRATTWSMTPALVVRFGR